MQEDRDLLAQIQEAVSSLTGAKGVHPDRVAQFGEGRDAETHAVNEHATDVVLGLLSSSGTGGKRPKAKPILLCRKALS